MGLGILIVCGADFRAPSEKQALWLSEALVAAGHRVRISLAGDPETAASEGADQVEGLEITSHAPGKAGPGAPGFAPDVVYALNARLPVISSARAYAKQTGAPIFVHFEDDEWGLRHAPKGTPLSQRAIRAARRVAATVDPGAWRFATKGTLAWVAEHARGIDALTPALAREVQRRLKREATVIPPASPRHGPRPLTFTMPPAVNGRRAIALTGALYDAHVADVSLAMRATALLRDDGRDIVLVHAGDVAPRLDAHAIARGQGLDDAGLVLLGYRQFGEVLGLLREADVLVQPGQPSEFNRLRLPSKLQGYLASARPTVTYSVGLDELLEDRREVLFTKTGEPQELADRIAEVLDDDVLRARLSHGGPEAAARLFDADANAAKLVAHFEASL